MIALVAASNKDQAAVNIADKLIANFGFQKTMQSYAGKPIFRRGEVLLAYIDVDSVHAEYLDREFDVETIIFASRHRSESGERTLTVHATGNTTSKATHDGKPKSLAWANPQRMKSALQALKQAREDLSLLEYSVSLEATHHGPTELKIPVLFVEIGSSEKEWVNDKAGEAVAKAIYAAASEPRTAKASVGFGGGHYPTKHTNVDLESEYAIGHILSKYFFDEFDASIVKLALKKTINSCGAAIVDWKGLKSSHRTSLIPILENEHVEIVKV